MFPVTRSIAAIVPAETSDKIKFVFECGHSATVRIAFLQNIDWKVKVGDQVGCRECTRKMRKQGLCL